MTDANNSNLDNRNPDGTWRDGVPQRIFAEQEDVELTYGDTPLAPDDSSNPYARSYGSRYGTLGKYPAASTIATAVRNDIKAAVAAGDLPGKPVTYSVTSETFSGGQAVEVQIRDWPGSFRVPQDENRAQWGRDLTPEAQTAYDTVKAIRSAYNHDGSDIMTDYFDVLYYGGVDFEDEFEANWRRKQAQERKDKKAAGGAK